MNSYIKVIKFSLELIKIVEIADRFEDEEVKKEGKKLNVLIQELGPTYEKFGQLLSLRYDIFPKQVCDILHQLLDAENKLPFGIIKKILKKELGEKYYDFKEIKKDPIAVASVGQVHIGYLNSGEKVAIKIQKPGIRHEIIKDLKAFYTILTLLNIFPPIRKLRMKQVLKEFETWTLKELDFINEAHNTMDFTNYFKHEKFIYIPKVYTNYSSARILVTEFIDGVSLNQVIKEFSQTSEDMIIVKEIKVSKKHLIKMFKDNIFKQIFEIGLIHGDPHPSNIIIKDSNTIALIDFGVITELNKLQQNVIKTIFYNIIRDKRNDVIKGFIKLDLSHKNVNETAILHRLNPSFDKLLNSTPSEYNPTHFLLDSVFILSNFGMQIPLFIIILAKVLSIYDGILLSIEPRTKFFDEVAPMFELDAVSNSIDEIINPNNYINKLRKPADSLLNLITSLPLESEELLNEIKINGIKAAKNYSEIPERSSQSIRFIGLIVFALVAFIGFLISALTNNQTDLVGVRLSLILASISVILISITLFYLLKEN